MLYYWSICAHYVWKRYIIGGLRTKEAYFSFCSRSQGHGLIVHCAVYVYIVAWINCFMYCATGSFAYREKDVCLRVTISCNLSCPLHYLITTYVKFAGVSQSDFVNLYGRPGDDCPFSLLMVKSIKFWIEVARILISIAIPLVSW